LVPGAHEVPVAAERALVHAQTLRDGEVGRLRIGATPQVMQTVLPTSRALSAAAAGHRGPGRGGRRREPARSRGARRLDPALAVQGDGEPLEHDVHPHPRHPEDPYQEEREIERCRTYHDLHASLRASILPGIWPIRSASTFACFATRRRSSFTYPRLARLQFAPVVSAACNSYCPSTSRRKSHDRFHD
jgi:hypothetical protein